MTCCLSLLDSLNILWFKLSSLVREAESHLKVQYNCPPKTNRDGQSCIFPILGKINNCSVAQLVCDLTLSMSVQKFGSGLCAIFTTPMIQVVHQLLLTSVSSFCYKLLLLISVLKLFTLTSSTNFCY